MKHFILLISLFMTLGLQAVPYRSLASFDLPEACLGGRTQGQMQQDIAGLLIHHEDLISQVTYNSLAFNPRYFSSYEYFGPSYSYGTSLSSPFFNSLSADQMQSYNDKVARLTGDMVSKQRTTWSPTFDQNGLLQNGFYGYGAQTSYAIEHMYQLPTMANPFSSWQPATVPKPEQIAQTTLI